MGRTFALRAAAQPAAMAACWIPFKPRITRLLDTHPYSAQQIFQRLREDGYRGGVTILRDYVRRIRPTKRPVYLKLDFAPGECAQVDWGAYGTVAVGNTRRRLSFFVMVLAFSRQMYVEFTVSQTMEHFLACHERTFTLLLVAVPAKIMVDNLKSAVLQRLMPAPHRCSIRAIWTLPATMKKLCDRGLQRRPRGNGEEVVWSQVWSYVKRISCMGFRVGRLQCPSTPPHLGLARLTIANVRIHGATQQRRLLNLACARACSSGIAQPTPLRPRTHVNQCRLQPVPHHAGHQSLFRPRRLRSPPIDPSKPTTPTGSAFTSTTSSTRSRHTRVVSMVATRTSRIRITQRV